MFYFRSGKGCRAWRPGFLLVGLTCFLWVQSGQSVAAEVLTLAEATQRMLTYHPELQVFKWRFRGIDGQRQTADMNPGYQLSFGAEDLAGNGDYSGTQSAEYTLSLSSIIELGGKRNARVAVALSQYALAEAEREAKALDLLGMLTRRFIAALSLQEKLDVARQTTRLAEQTYRLVNTRVQRGVVPEAERLRAQVLLKQAQIREQALIAEHTSRKFALAALWKAEHADFERVGGDLFLFDQPASFKDLYQRVANSPALQVFASEARMRDAEVALARSQSSLNVGWSLGVRRYDQTDDTAFTAGVSIPLFSESRNRGQVQSALADREQVQYRREASLLEIRARLFTAWQTFQQSANATDQLRTEVLPALEEALEQTREAYELGRYSYVNWISAQRELLDARMTVIDAATTALLNQALIEQLTAEPLGMEGFAEQDAASTAAFRR